MAQALMLAIAGILIGLLNLLVGDQFKEYSPWFVRRLLAIATKRLPETQQQRFAEEWTSHMNHVSGDIQKILFAWGCVCAAREMATLLTHNETKHALVACQVVTVFAGILWLENFHHGWVVPLFSAFVIWRERNRLARIPLRASRYGLVVMVGATVLLIVGEMGAELYITRTSLVFMIAGAVILFTGWEFFRALLFPWAFLFLMIPIPAILFNRITFPLQILASDVAAATLSVFGVPALRLGNVMDLGSLAVEVAEAFSGIRDLMSLAILAIIYGYLVEKRIWLRWLLVFPLARRSCSLNFRSAQTSRHECTRLRLTARARTSSCLMTPASNSISLGRRTEQRSCSPGESNDPASAIHVFDLATQKVSDLPGSQGFFSPRWSPDGRHISALSSDSRTLLLFDTQTQKWTELADHSAGSTGPTTDNTSTCLIRRTKKWWQEFTSVTKSANRSRI